MGRIEDALRLKLGQENSRSYGAQEKFAPAWRVSDSPDVDRPSVPTRLPQTTGHEVSGSVVSFSSAWRERLAHGPDGEPMLIEQFRRLAASLHRAPLAGGRRSVMVTSAAPGDGKTLTAVNLAIVLSESFRASVLLIDADLRRPSIQALIDLKEGSGLSEVLRSPHEQKLALVPLSPRLTLLPAGQPVANSLEALTSPRMQEIMDEALTRFDWVILDAPPLGPTTDARLLGEMVGGTLFVIHARKTKCEHVQRAIEGFGPDRLLGVVLNGVELEPSEGYYYLSSSGDSKT